MHRALIGPWERMGKAKDRLLGRVGRFSAEARDARPPGGGWGVLEVVEHIVLVEAGVASALAKAPSPERPRVLGGGGRAPFWAVRLILLGGIRYRVPVEAVRPRGELGWDALLQEWGATRERLGGWLEGAPPEVITAPRFKHPICGWLDVPHALTFLADHLVHHLAQIRRLQRGRWRGPG